MTETTLWSRVMGASLVRLIYDEQHTNREAPTMSTTPTHETDCPRFGWANEPALARHCTCTTPNPDAADAYARQSTETCDHGRLLWQSCRECGVAAYEPPSEAETLARVTGSVAATVIRERRHADGSLTVERTETWERPEPTAEMLEAYEQADGA